MTAAALEELVRLLTEAGLVYDLVAANGLVHGRALIDGVGADIAMNVDPEFDEVDDPDLTALVGAVAHVIGMGEARWRAVVDTAATEIEDATADDDVLEQTDLRDDMGITSVVVFADAALLAFRAARQFPDARILVQVDNDFEVDSVEVVDDAGVETCEFSLGDGLLDHLSRPTS